MTSNTALDAIDLHTYGLRAADARKPLIDQILTFDDNQSLVNNISIVTNIKDPELRDRAMQSLIHMWHTGDRDAASRIITGYEYVQAHLHLGKAMHALSIQDQTPGSELQMPILGSYIPQLDEMHIYPQPAADYTPASASIIEILTETIQASNAPSAAISAATCSI